VSPHSATEGNATLTAEYSVPARAYLSITIKYRSTRHLTKIEKTETYPLELQKVTHASWVIAVPLTKASDERTRFATESLGIMLMT
jgi:hypothetical protein